MNTWISRKTVWKAKVDVHVGKVHVSAGEMVVVLLGGEQKIGEQIIVMLENGKHLILFISELQDWFEEVTNVAI